MDDNTTAVVITALLSTTVLLTLLGRAIFASRRAKVQAGDPMTGDRLRGIEERINHLQQSVDAIAVEVERVSEGQRFATKLLADRGASASVARSER